MATALTKTNVTATNRKKFTFSCWLKRGKLGVQENFFGSIHNGSNEFQMRFDSDDELRWAGSIGGSAAGLLNTKRLFRDTLAWYHIVITGDTTQATNINRLKLYINGTQIADGDFNSPGYPGQDTNFGFGTSDFNFCFGVSTPGTTNDPFSGKISHAHFVDGEAYAASTFGSTDSTTGEWKINTSPTITEYGANGFFMFKDDASLNDDSGKGNNFTLVGTIIPTQDNPSNNFAVINFLNPNAGSNLVFSGGNSSINSTGGAHRNAPASFSLPLGNGKFYWEMKVDRISTHVKVGVVCDEWVKLNKPTPGEEHSGSNQGYSYRNDGQKENNGITSFGNSYTAGDIIGIAFDTENRNLYYAKNGTWQNSGDPTSGASGTGKAFTVDDGYVYIPIVNLYNADVSFNFGDGYFETTAISSEGTNASGIGKFEYDVPTGYTALSTKGLNE